MAWTKLATDTLVSDATSITLTFEKKKFMLDLFHSLYDGSNNKNLFYRMGDGSVSTDTIYAERHSGNDGAEATTTSGTSWGGYTNTIGTGAYDEFKVTYICNISGEEVLGISFECLTLAGATNAPNRYEQVGKFETTQIDRIAHLNNVNMDANSNASALGTD